MSRHVAGVLSLLLLVPGVSATRRADPIFTAAPTAIANVTGIIPLGSANPGGGHVLPVDHNYLNYPVPETGTLAYPVYAMGAGAITMIVREQFEGRPDPDYSIFMFHTKEITSYVIHIHELSPAIQSHIAGSDAWIDISPVFSILLLGQGDAPAPFDLAAGDDLGITKNYSHNWDIGVIDTHVHGDFVGRGERRYPTLADYMTLFGIAADPPYRGQDTLNAACFLDYMTDELQAAWRPLLLSDDGSCGLAGWDVRGRLRGAWFNPGLDVPAVPPLGEIEAGAISIAPDPYRPSSHVQIAFGTGGAYSAFDPGGTVPQLRQPFYVEIDMTPGTRINPDPAAVRIRGGTVCYDLQYNDIGLRFNTLEFYLLGSNRLEVRYDPTPRPNPSCFALPLSLPDDTWIEYVR